VLCLAQEPAYDSKQDRSVTGDQGFNQENPFNQQQPNPAGTSGIFVRALNSANPLTGGIPLQWGWVSLRSATYQQYFSPVNFDNPAGTMQSEDIVAANLLAAIVVDHTFANAMRFTLQYSPSLTVTNGSVYPNALNQNAGLDTSFLLSPRWTLQLSDRFTYNGSQRAFVGLPFDANFETGLSVAQSYLSGPGTVLYNIASATFSYNWTPLTTITFGPSLGYQYASGTANSGGSINSVSGGGQMMISHSLSPTQTIRLSYTGNYANYQNSSQTAGPQSNSFLQDVLVTYSLQFRETWLIHLGAGLTSNFGADGGTGIGLNVGISKSFRQSSLSGVFTRGHQFNGFITGSVSDNAGLTHSIYWTPRFSTATSGYYTQTPGANPSGQSSWYAIEQLNFGLTQQLSLNGAFGYTKQVGDGVYVISSNRRFVTFGITWSAYQPTRR
jgi:hypothetical protein